MPKPTVSRRRAPASSRAGGTRDRILAAARALYVTGGAAAVTVRAVERRARVTAPTVYWHFRDMRQLVNAVVDDAFQGLADRLPASLGEPTARGRLVAAARIYRDYGLEFPTLYAAMFVAPDRNRALRAGPARTVGRRTFDFLVARVEECIEAGLFRGADAHQMAVRIWAVAHGFVSLQIARRLGLDPIQFDAAYDSAIASLFGVKGTLPLT